MYIMNQNQSIRLGILGSTRGTSLQPIIDAIENKELNAEIRIIISNKPDAGILEKAKQHNLNLKYIPTEYIDGKKKQREEYDNEVSIILKSFGVNLILMIGYMRIVSKSFTDTWKNKCLNVHPSLLPDFAKGMDIAVHNAVLKSGKKHTGCTVHMVTDEVDGGPIIHQEKCEVKDNDTPETLKERVQKLEGLSFILSIEKLRNNMFRMEI